MNIEQFVSGLDNVSGDAYSGYSARCPAHDDHNNSLSIGVGDKQPIILDCHAGCEFQAIVAARGLTMMQVCGDAATTERVQQQVEDEKPGLTLKTYACRKKLDINLLIVCGMYDSTYNVRVGDTWVEVPSVAIPYQDRNRDVTRVRHRIRMTGDRFRWAKGDGELSLYGLLRKTKRRLRLVGRG